MTWLRRFFLGWAWRFESNYLQRSVKREASRHNRRLAHWLRINGGLR